MRVGARDERAGDDEALLGEVEVEDAVTGRRVVRTLDAVHLGERASDPGLLVVRLTAVEHEVVVRDRGLAREDRVPAGDLVEGVDRERCRAVRSRKEVAPHPDRRSRPHLGVAVDAMRPRDLLARREPARRTRVGPLDLRRALERLTELAAADGDDPAGAADVLLLRRERERLVRAPPRLVREPARRRIEREGVTFLRVLHRLA